MNDECSDCSLLERNLYQCGVHAKVIVFCKTYRCARGARVRMVKDLRKTKSDKGRKIQRKKRKKLRKRRKKLGKRRKKLRKKRKKLG